jgi:hypothetical protein
MILEWWINVKRWCEKQHHLMLKIDATRSWYIAKIPLNEKCTKHTMYMLSKPKDILPMCVDGFKLPLV